MHITRRQFLKYVSASAVALGFTQADILKLSEVLAAQTSCSCHASPHVIWISGQACSGCPESLLNRVNDPAETITPELGVVQDVIDLLVGDTTTAAKYSGAGTAVPAGSTVTPINPSFDWNRIQVGDLFAFASSFNGAGPDPGLVVPVVAVAPPTFTVGGVFAGAHAELFLTIGTATRAGWANFPKGYVCLDYNDVVMASAGSISTDHLKSLRNGSEIYVVAVDGAIPFRDQRRKWKGKDARYCVIAEMDLDDGRGVRGVSVIDMLNYLLGGPCGFVLCWGTCSSYGGIPAAAGNQTQAMGVYQALKHSKGKHNQVPVVNVPGCPPHPDWMIYPVAYFLINYPNLPPLTDPVFETYSRPDPIYGIPEELPLSKPRAIYTGDKGYEVFCERCMKTGGPTCPDHGAGPGMTQASDPPGNKELCLRSVGCNGYMASPDCPTRMWNLFDDGTKNNWCVGGNLHTSDQSGANFGCMGCAEHDFPDGRSPFFDAVKNGK